MSMKIKWLSLATGVALMLVDVANSIKPFSYPYVGNVVEWVLATLLLSYYLTLVPDWKGKFYDTLELNVEQVDDDDNDKLQLVTSIL
jgi:hypothetical protein